MGTPSSGRGLWVWAAAVLCLGGLASAARVPLAHEHARDGTSLSAGFNGNEIHSTTGIMSPFLHGDILKEALAKLRQIDGTEETDDALATPADSRLPLDADPRVIPYAPAKRTVYFDEYSKEGLNETLSHLWTISPSLKEAYDKAKADLEGQFLYVEKMVKYLREERLRVAKACPPGLVQRPVDVNTALAGAPMDFNLTEGNSTFGPLPGASPGNATGGAGEGAAAEARFRGKSFLDKVRAAQEKTTESKQQLQLCQMSLNICLTDQKTTERERDMYKKVYKQGDEYKRLKNDAAATGSTIKEALDVIEQDAELKKQEGEEERQIQKDREEAAAMEAFSTQ